MTWLWAVAAAVAAVSVANFGGTSSAVRIGRRMRDKRPRACACGCPVAAVKP